MANIQAKNVMSEPFLKKKDNSNSVVRIPDSYVDNLTIKDVIAEFPKLVQGGQFVKALEVIDGHRRFHWFYNLIEKVPKRLLCESERVKPLESLDMSISSESENYYTQRHK